MAGAAGGFVARAFDSMLKECSGRKYAPLQKAIQTYTDSTKEIIRQPISGQANQVVPLDGVESSMAIESKISEDIDATSSVKETLSNAGQTLDDSEADILLNPLKIAFDTKNIKVIELALDCLHKLIAYDHLEGDPGLEGGKNCALFTTVLDMVCNCVDNSSPDSTILQVLKALLTSASSAKFRVHGESLIGVIRVCYNIALNSKSGINQSTSKAMLTQIISIIFRRLETDLENPSGSTTSVTSIENKHVHGTSNSTIEVKDATLASLEELQNLAGTVDIKGLEAAVDKVVQIENSERTVRGIEFESLSVAQRDALMLFHTLCKMSMKEDTDEVTTKTRILSLELLQGLLEGVASFFNKNVYFVDSMKAYLSYTLLRTAVSRSPIIFKYAIGILSVLLLRYREHLKGEIGIFFPLIILRSLDGLDFLISQRIAVLKMLENVCKSPQMLVDLFVNYDCVLEAANLFEHMVMSLSKIAQGLQNAEPNMVSGTQMGSVKSLSLQCLVNVLKSLVDWEKTHRHLDKNNKMSTSLENDLPSGNLGGVEKIDGQSIMFEKAKAHKTTMEAAISEFNREPVKGMQYLIENGLVERSPQSVALFLRNTVGLDKTMIGDYLGQHEEFPLAVMHAYANSMNFSGMKFASSLREFLSRFRLPGEAQKIDRIMEKFAERYCADNPGLFQNADTAYVLAYSVIMLNTDAHNPMVSLKMSKLDFIHMNAMSDAELCAPTELLEEIYDSIVAEEIKLKDDGVGVRKTNRQKQDIEEKQGLIGILNLAVPKHKAFIDSKLESASIIKQVQVILRKNGTQRVDFYTSHRIEVVRPMIEAVGWPLLATFSVTMEEGENKSRVGFCMDGFRAVIHITQVLGMDTMRYAFLTSLIRFNFLHAPKDIRSKNVEALKTLLGLCDTEIDSFQDTWNAVLECISRLERITSSPSISATVMHGSNQISRDGIVQSLRELAGKSSEQLFINSVKLPSDSIVEFFTALCGVSAEEMKQTPPRVFGLQKLVEISYYNMARIRLVWARIWSVLSIHFVSAGSHHDPKISMYAIDSLRQLSMKYLEREELANFTFQNDILKPFVVLIRNSHDDSVRRLIVDCIVQMIKSKVGNIKSGWKSVFMIFTAAADDENESTVESAFENVEQVILEHFDQVIGDCFMDCVNCLIAFANSKSSHRISLKAIALLRICEDRLAEGLIPGGALKPIHLNADTSYDVTEHYWFPMLAGLSDLTSDTRIEVGSCALEVLFDLLNERGKKFSTPFWESIFHRVLFPIFDHVRYAGKVNIDSANSGWIGDSSVHSLQLLCTLFSTFYKEVCFMLSSLLGLLLDCAKKTDQKVVSISLGALVHLIEVGGHKFSENDWDTLLNSIRDASHTTQPLELLNDMGFEYTKGQKVLAEITQIEAAKSAEKSDDQQIDFTQDAIQGQTNPDVIEHTGESKVPNIDNSHGVLQPSQVERSHSEIEPQPQNKTISQKIMGNVMDSLFLRNLTKPQEQDVDGPSVPSTSDEIHGLSEPVIKSEPENSLLTTVRAKSVTQLLLLGTVDSIQKKFWDKMTHQQKIFIMDILVSLLEFSATYNSYAGLRMRMNHIPSERPPINLLRQELEGTRIYLEILQRATYDSDENCQIDTGNDGTSAISSNAAESDHSENYDGDKLCMIAEDKLVCFCEQILKEASLIQSGNGNKTEVHRVVELRSPIVIKVLQSMTTMNSGIFKKHLREFYPWITKLVCCDQVDVRVAVGDVFVTKVSPLLAVAS